MKRANVLLAVALTLLALLGVSVLQSEAISAAPVQFEGFVRYVNGSPAPYGTKVETYLGGVLKGSVTITRTDGFYQITGEHADFPTGTYHLGANDQVSASGDENCFKYVEYQACNITLDVNY